MLPMAKRPFDVVSPPSGRAGPPHHRRSGRQALMRMRTVGRRVTFSPDDHETTGVPIAAANGLPPNVDRVRRGAPRRRFRGPRPSPTTEPPRRKCLAEQVNVKQHTPVVAGEQVTRASDWISSAIIGTLYSTQPAVVVGRDDDARLAGNRSTGQRQCCRRLSARYRSIAKRYRAESG